MKTGGYLEATADRIDEGKFLSALNDALRRAMTALDDYEKTTEDLKGKVKVAVAVNMSRMKGSREFMTLDYQINVTPPKKNRSVVVRGGQGRLLVDADGEGSLNNADQLLLPTFDRFGNERAAINKDTGEVVEDEDTGVAGTLNKNSG